MYPYGVYFRTRLDDGSEHWMQTRGRIRRDADGRPHRVARVTRDVTERISRTAERVALEERRRHQTRIVEGTTAALSHARTVRDVIDVLGNAAGLERLGLASVVMGLVEADRIELITQGQDGSYIPAIHTVLVSDEYPMSEAVRTRAPRFVPSREEIASSYPLLWARVEPLAISAAAYLPLIAQARPIGVLGLFYKEERPFPSEERNLLIALEAASRRACSARCCTSRRTLSPRVSSRPCCRGPCRPLPVARSRSATARRAPAGTSAGTGMM